MSTVIKREPKITSSRSNCDAALDILGKRRRRIWTLDTVMRNFINEIDLRSSDEAIQV